MQIIDIESNIKPDANVATIGFFDGVHLGHQFLINQVKEIAEMRGLKSSVLTFLIHPRKVIAPNKPVHQITLCDEKLEQLEKTGLDYCFLLNFSKELSELSARKFMQEVLLKRFNVKILVIGYDHRFGHNRSDGFEQYVSYGKELGIEVIQAKEYKMSKKDISSSTIRKALSIGDIDIVNCCLGYSYYINGTVITGKQIGRTIGFPTANIQVVNGDKIIPANGVYAVKVKVEDDDKCYWGMLNIGHRPTINNGCNRSIEVNILDFSRDIYKKKIRLMFIKHLRPEIKFESLEKLVEALHKDEANVRKLKSSND